MTRRWSVALGLCLALLAPGPLRAQDEASEDPPRPNDAAAMEGAQERARLHFAAGASYYEAASYEDALREFRHAYEMSGRPQLLYNLSLCYQNLGRLEEAIAHLRRYLDEVEDIPNRANLEIRIQNFERRLEEQRAEAEAEAEARVEAEQERDSATQRDASPTPRVAPAPSEGDGPNVGAIAGFSVAAVGVVLAGVMGGLTLAEDGRLADECSPNCADDEVSTLQTFALLTDIGFGVALGGAAVGLLLLLLDSGGGSDDTPAAMAPWLRREGGGLSVGGTF